MLKNVAQKMAVVTAPAIVAMGADRALSAVTTFSHILSGQGAGSGWDNSETRVAASLVHSATPVVFDVGANNGKWSRRLSDVLGPGASFHLFECAPICFDELEVNRAAISNAVHVNAAVSDREGTATLHFPRASGLGGAARCTRARMSASRRSTMTRSRPARSAWTTMPTRPASATSTC